MPAKRLSARLLRETVGTGFIRRLRRALEEPENSLSRISVDHKLGPFEAARQALLEAAIAMTLDPQMQGSVPGLTAATHGPGSEELAAALTKAIEGDPVVAGQINPHADVMEVLFRDVREMLGPAFAGYAVAEAAPKAEPLGSAPPLGPELLPADRSAMCMPTALHGALTTLHRRFPRLVAPPELSALETAGRAEAGNYGVGMSAPEARRLASKHNALLLAPPTSAISFELLQRALAGGASVILPTAVEFERGELWGARRDDGAGSAEHIVVADAVNPERQQVRVWDGTRREGQAFSFAQIRDSILWPRLHPTMLLIPSYGQQASWRAPERATGED